MSLLERRNKPLAEESEDIAGPLVSPGRYTVELQVAGKTQRAPLTVLKDPRLKVTQRAFDQQSALLHRLYAKWSELNEAVNRIRRLKRQLVALAARETSAPKAVAGAAQRLREELAAIEAKLVDVKRESPRDVLRHEAGLNDTLVDLISVVAIADEAPTTQARQVCDEIMAGVDVQLKRLAACTQRDMPKLNAALRAAGVEVLGA